MNLFFDTSVLVAACWERHPNHDEAFEIYSTTTLTTSCCAAHTLAELYAVTTRLPVKPRILPEQSMLFIEDLKQRLSLITLTVAEYLATVERTAEAGWCGGKIYDALLLAAAKKSGAGIIYTFNVQDFARIAPELKARIRTPPAPNLQSPLP